MAGRPRTMAKRVKQLLERHNKLGDDLWKVMPKQYVPDPAKGERWDSEFAEAEGSTLACLWRRAIHEFANSNEWLLNLTAYLGVRADEAEQNARPTDAEDTGLGDDQSASAGDGRGDKQGEQGAAEMEQTAKSDGNGHVALSAADTPKAPESYLPISRPAGLIAPARARVRDFVAFRQPRS